MNFKPIWALIGVTLLMLVSTGCSDFLNGKKAKNENLKIELPEASCANNFKQKMNKIVQSESSEADIRAVFGCIDKYLNTFQNKVEGEARADIYDAQDLLYITNRFFKDLKLSKDIIKKITNFKKALIGGDGESISKNEITEIREFLNNKLQPEMILLVPHLKHLSRSSQNQNSIDQNEVSQALEQARKSLKVILGPAHFVRTGYSYNDLKELLFDLNIFNSSDHTLIDSLEKVRQLLMGNEELKTNEDLLVFVDNALDAYRLFLTVCDGQVKFEISSLDQVSQLINFFDGISDLLNSSYQFKKTGHVNTRDLDQVLEILIEKKIFPFEVQFKTFQDFYKIVLKRVLLQENSDFISEKQFQNYRKESELFKLEISFLKNLESHKMYSVAEIKSLFKMFSVKKSFYAVSTILSHAERYKVTMDWIDMHIDFFNGYPILVKDKTYILSKNLDLEKFSSIDLLRSFYIKMLGRQLIMGWGSGQLVPQFNLAKLTREQMITFSREFKPFGIEMKLNDPRSKDDGSKSFLEANLFGFTSDGNDTLSISETFEYMHYLVAEGAGTTQQIQQDLAQVHCEKPELDVFGHHWNPEACFIQNLKHNFSSYFKGKPGLVRYLTSLSEQEFMNYYDLVMSFSRFDQKNKNVAIETADIQNFVVVSNYIEAMFVKYDINLNQSLSASEIRAAYPKFKSFAVDYSQKHAADSLHEWDSFFNICKYSYTKDDLMRESFIFMVLNQGRKPVSSDMNYLSCAGKGLFTFKNEIDRKSIIYTFLVLKDVLASDK